MAQIAYRRLCDWTPQAGPVEDWLARWAEAGWVPEWPPPYDGVDADIGSSWVRRFAMVRAGSYADRYAVERATIADPAVSTVPASQGRPRASLAECPGRLVSGARLARAR